MNLRAILARLSAGAPSSITLPHGLYLRTERDGSAILLHAARKGVTRPSPKELAVLVAFWPAAPTLPIQPTPRETSTMTGYTLRLVFPRPVFGQPPTRGSAYVQTCPSCLLIQASDYICSGCGKTLPASIPYNGEDFPDE